MAIEQYKDAESGEADDGLQELQEPFIQEDKACKEVESDLTRVENGSIGMVLFSTFVAVCGSFAFGTCTGYSAPTQLAIREDLNLSLAEMNPTVALIFLHYWYPYIRILRLRWTLLLYDEMYLKRRFSLFGSLITIGGLLGAVTSGRIADFVGRKGAMRLSTGFCIVGWLAVFFSKGSYSLDIGRFFTGYGIGVTSYVVPVYIAEIAPKNLRGGLATTNQLMIVTGSSISFLVGSLVTWRTLALAGLLPCITLLIGLCFVPDSPRWLAKIGHEKEFKEALKRLRGENVDISQEAAEILEYIEALQSLPKTKLLDLFQSKYVRCVVIGVGLMVCQQAVGINGIGFYTAETFVAAGFSSPKVGTTAYACLQLPATALGAILMDKSGRRPLIMVSTGGTFVGSILTGIAFYLKGQSLLLGWVPVLAFAGILLDWDPVPWVIMSEIFPINVKGTAGSLIVLICWSGGWVVSYTFNFLMSWSSPGTWFLYAGCSLLTILFVAKLVPETKGKTLEEIHGCINS